MNLMTRRRFCYTTLETDMDQAAANQMEETMSIKTVFRNLVTNKFMAYFDYENQAFSFQTVFHQSYYHYCCCTCAFEHEYLDYLSDTGEINETMYEKMVDSIANGKCLHVDKASEDNIAETAIYGIHVAAAVDTEEALVKVKEQMEQRRFYSTSKETKIFRLDPYDIALVKNNTWENVAGIKFWKNRSWRLEPLYAFRLFDNKDLIQIGEEPIPKFCARQNNTWLLRTNRPQLIHSDHTVMKAMECAMKQGMVDLQQFLLGYISESKCIYNSSTGMAPLAISSIVYDQPKSLAAILTQMKPNELNDAFKCELVETCYALNRKGCKEVLMRQNVFRRNNSDEIKLKRLKCLLDTRTLYDDLKKEVCTILKEIPSARIMFQPKLMPFNSHSLRTMFELDVAWNFSRNHCTLLEDYIDANFFKYQGSLTDAFNPSFRSTLELFIYENSGLTQNTSAVRLGLELDETHYGVFEEHKRKKTYDYLQHRNQCYRSKNYLMDTREHSLFGHDGDDFALNFVGPLLIECGYPVSQITKEDALHRKLHPAELRYLRQYYYETPRSLNVLCRDILRKHFTGRKIHAFVSATDIPKPVADVLLLKPILRCLDV